MDSEFKVPTFEPKLKAVPKKTTTDEQSVDAESKEIISVPTATAPKESERAKCETDLKKTVPKCPYVEPKWSRPPQSSLAYNFEVLKGGQIVENMKNLQDKPFWTIGKLPGNDIVMAHPTISRFHAVLQYRPDVSTHNGDSSDSSSDEDDKPDQEQKPKVEKGWYLYDMNSTHGSFVNKMKVPPKTYVRVRVGYMLKFGASTRMYILQGPNFDEETESELTITEMKELKLKKIQEQQDKLEEEEKRKEEQGISWGMAEDADEETDLSHNPFASSNNEELFLDDPKKTLRGFFEREGHNLDYNVDELSNGTYLCKIELPITNSMGRSIIAEYTHKGKKKDCVVQCALEACRILDRNGLLRQANHEPRKRKIESSSDDDDEFYDRTAEAEEKRRRKAGADDNVSLSYEQLLEEEDKLNIQLAATEKRLERYQQMEKASKVKEAMDVDDLDDFVSTLSSEKQMDKAEVRKCRFERQRIRNDIQKVKKLINIARPVELPPLQPDQGTSDASQAKKTLPLFGKKKTFGFDKLKQQVSAPKSAPSNENQSRKDEAVEEFDEDAGDAKSKRKINKDVPQVTSSTDAPKPPESCDTRKTENITANQATSKLAAEPVKPTEEPTIQSTEKPNETETRKSKTSHPTIPSQSSSEEKCIPTSSESVASSRNRAKNRNRNKIRHQVDIDDTEGDKSPQKYSGWVPPENQSGDGITELNSKYGY